MDRRVKERLIGASILVAFVVLVVPELLSGAKPTAVPAPTLPAAAPDPTRSVEVDLATSRPPANAAAEPVVPDTPASAAAAPAAAADNAAASGVPGPAPGSGSSGPTSPRVGGSWSVQLGSFANRANAVNLTRQLQGQGFSAFVLPGGSGSSRRYRVRVGPLADRETAERMAAKLKSQGHLGSLVAPAA
jgi:DedD protein